MSGTVPGLVNFRDLGGTPVAGGAVRAGVLFRSAAPAGLPEAAWGALADLGIATIVDLRTPSERALAPTTPPPSMVVRELPLLEGAMSPELFRQFGGDLSRVPTLGQLYTDMLADGGPVFAEVAQVAATAKGGVLVHCTAGKDRTGIAVALLLDAIGAQREAVVADYAATQAELSGAWTERMLAGLSAMGVPATPEIAGLATSSPAEVMEGILDGLDAEGGASAYLTRHGATDADLALLRQRLVADAPS
ncbi:MAG: tyrosine-protein phosphatase [Propionicimonas sp.]|uniref:tyrosine-protein phosphatase n=1 Tax=Propionicimonas sp. TaxID=1955623 RepID=UPI003D122CDB